jgi:hypothetical protein
MISIVQPENKFLKQQGTITLQVSLPHVNNDLVKFITQTGRLFYGNLHKDLFDKKFKELKNNFLTNQLTNVSSTAIDTLQPSSFNLHMIRVALNQSWRWPALITELANGLHFSAGNSRILASGISKDHPDESLKFLILQNANSPPDKFLNNPIEITNDQTLHSVLGLIYDTGVCDSELTVAVDQILDADQIKYSLVTLYDGNTEHHFHAGAELLANYHAWIWKYGLSPKLKIYTNWPELIVDTSKQWAMNIEGLSHRIKDSNFKLGHIENFIRNQANTFIQPNEHALFVTAPRRIDVGELLCWVDLDHNVWIDQNADFALFRSSTEYNTRLIRIST